MMDTDSDEAHGPLAETPGARLNDRIANLAQMSQSELLGSLTEAQYLVDYWSVVVDALAEQARVANISWTEIARSAGLTQQAAHKRWSPEAMRKRNELRQKKRRLLPHADAPSTLGHLGLPSADAAG